LSALDPAVSGDDTVSVNPLLLHPEIAAVMDDELVHLLERPLVQEQADPFPRSQLAGLVLFLNPVGAAAQLGQLVFSRRLAIFFSMLMSTHLNEKMTSIF
jgi:hypothetical protein